MAKKKPVKKEKSFEEKLWDTAIKLRGGVEVPKYKYIAIGLMFLKFISDRFEERKKELELETKDPKSPNYCKTEKEREYILNLPDQYRSKGAFFLKKGTRWSDLAKIVTEENIALRIDKMLLDIEKDNPSLEGVLPREFGTTSIRNDNLQELINEYGRISATKEEAKDLFGRTYEFFIERLHSLENPKGGEFFTPPSIVRLLVEILEPYEGKIYDPTCGSGGMFVQSQKFIDAHRNNQKSKGLSIYGVESQNGIWRICKMNLAVRGIDSKNIVQANCLTQDPFPNLKANRVLANPPFNQDQWGLNLLQDHRMFRNYGAPSDGQAGGNYAFLSHMLHHLDEKDGMLGLVLANGSMSCGGTEGDMRKKIIEADRVDCIITLPSNLFYTVTVSACLWFCTMSKDDGKSRKRNGETLFIDAKKIFTKVTRARNEFSEDQLQKIVGTYRSYIGEKGYPKYEDDLGYCKVVTIREIAEKNYLLMPGRYVGATEIEDDNEPFPQKMKRLMQELARLSEESQNIDKEIHKNIEGIGF